MAHPHPHCSLFFRCHLAYFQPLQSRNSSVPCRRRALLALVGNVSRSHPWPFFPFTETPLEFTHHSVTTILTFGYGSFLVALLYLPKTAFVEKNSTRATLPRPRPSPRRASSRLHLSLDTNARPGAHEPFGPTWLDEKSLPEPFPCPAPFVWLAVHLSFSPLLLPSSAILSAKTPSNFPPLALRNQILPRRHFPLA